YAPYPPVWGTKCLTTVRPGMLYSVAGKKHCMPRAKRHKISTTIAPENQAFLRSLIKRRKAANLAEAVDRAVSIARRADARREIEEATLRYYALLSGNELQQEQELENTVAHAATLVDFDAE